MKISECKLGLNVMADKALLGKCESGMIVGFVSNILSETIPVIKWSDTGIKSSVHPSNILKAVNDEIVGGIESREVNEAKGFK